MEGRKAQAHAFTWHTLTAANGSSAQVEAAPAREVLSLKGSPDAVQPTPRGLANQETRERTPHASRDERRPTKPLKQTAAPRRDLHRQPRAPGDATCRILVS